MWILVFPLRVWGLASLGKITKGVSVCRVVVCEVLDIVECSRISYTFPRVTLT